MLLPWIAREVEPDPTGAGESLRSKVNLFEWALCSQMFEANSSPATEIVRQLFQARRHAIP
jgi:hypothetical protein